MMACVRDGKRHTFFEEREKRYSKQPGDGVLFFDVSWQFLAGATPKYCCNLRNKKSAQTLPHAFYSIFFRLVFDNFYCRGCTIGGDLCDICP